MGDSITYKSCLIALVTIMLFAPLFSNGVLAEERNVYEKPTWIKGDKWSMGFERDLGNEFEDIERKIPMDELKEDGIDDINFDFKGFFGIYQTVEVVETSPSYKLKFSRGFGLEAVGSYEMVGETEKEGKYYDVQEDENGDWNVPKETMTFSIDINFEFAIKITGFEYYDENLALEKMDIHEEFAGKYELNVKNFPDFEEGDEEYDWDNDTYTLDYMDVKYRDLNIKVGGNIDFDILTEYSPALDIFQFPIVVGEEWTAYSEVTTSGKYNGNIDYNLSGDIPDEIYENLTLYPSPINITNLPGFGFPDAPIRNGIIKETTEEIEIDLKCTGEKAINLPNGGSTECCLIRYDDYEDEEWRGQDGGDHFTDDSPDDDEPEITFYFSEDEGYFVQSDINLPESGGFPELSYSAKSVSESEADNFIENKANPKNVNTNIEDESSFDNIYIGIIAIPLMVIIIGVVLFVKKKNNKNQKIQPGYGQFSQNPPYPPPPNQPPNIPQQPPQSFEPPNNQMPQQEPQMHQHQNPIPPPPSQYPRFLNCGNCGNVVPMQGGQQIVICPRCNTRIK